MVTLKEVIKETNNPEFIATKGLTVKGGVISLLKADKDITPYTKSYGIFINHSNKHETAVHGVTTFESEEGYELVSVKTKWINSIMLRKIIYNTLDPNYHVGNVIIGIENIDEIGNIIKMIKEITELNIIYVRPNLKDI